MVKRLLFNRRCDTQCDKTPDLSKTTRKTLLNTKEKAPHFLSKQRTFSLVRPTRFERAAFRVGGQRKSNIKVSQN